MLRRVRGLLACVMLALAWAPSAAAEAAGGLAAELAVDQPVVTVDLTGASPGVFLTYDVVVTNGGDHVAPGVVVEPRLPPELVRAGDGGPLVAGDVPPGGSWSGRFAATLDPGVTDALEVRPVVEARAADGSTATSAPAPTQVQVISATTFERFERSDRGGARVLGVELARTGAPLAALAVAGGALVLGGAVLRRSG